MCLAAALARLPGWTDAATPRPDDGDHAAIAEGWLGNIRARIAPGGTFSFMRPAFETSAGGNFSWNVGVDYATLLQGRGRAVVETLYEQSGLELEADLALLAGAPRIAADRDAAWFLEDAAVNFSGELRVPVLTVMTIGDPLLPVSGLWALEAATRRAGRQDQLRMAFTEVAGHCVFDPAEDLTAVEVMTRRLDSGTWGESASPEALNAMARGFGQDNGRFVPYDLEPLGRAFLLGDPYPPATAGGATRERG
jgi:hypothetical protein